ncbi:hypothetical protein HGI30_14395 [Paenibacillus albicereus]|uniref:Uncharacterized protein n=1 Tax=Paenibacillus albicereus TaxID=2726185 RepID=A0A6H2GZV5_9BACL|nr:hypothetical protein [Paenibacillus albicereus]QJC52638.1 hypothetical protein HGI30_14395 [Paenibacillus albicereus]
MASNPAYLPYTVLLVAALAVLLGIGWAKRKKRLGRAALLLSPLAAALMLLYYWHPPFHDAARSLLAPSRSYSCEHEGDASRSLEPFSIPLPKRTVFLGKSDACSPFYRTYATVDEFNRLYESELKDGKRSGAISGWTRIEPEIAEDGSGCVSEGYGLRLRDGRTVTIRMSAYAGEREMRMIAIEVPLTAEGSSK